MNSEKILKALPYTDPFLFVDQITEVTTTTCKGNYTFLEDAFFYKGHFKGNPITPGVILIECMAQIGLVCFGIFLLNDHFNDQMQVAFTSSNVEYLGPVFPNEKVFVVSDIKYFRFNKLKCNIKMFNIKDEVVAQGELAGIFSSKK